MKPHILIAAALCITPLATAQTEPAQPETAPTETAPQEAAPPEIISCLGTARLLEVFSKGEAERLPNYTESAGARVQRQFPNTHLYLHAKYIERGDKSIGICQYSNHVGVVSNYVLNGVWADAADGECGGNHCVNGGYWRQEWIETLEAEDVEGEEYIYTCMYDTEDGRAFPSGRCGFSPEAP